MKTGQTYNGIKHISREFDDKQWITRCGVIIPFVPGVVVPDNLSHPEHANCRTCLRAYAVHLREEAAKYEKRWRQLEVRPRTSKSDRTVSEKGGMMVLEVAT